MKVTYDRQVNAVYIYIASEILPGSIKKTYTCNPIDVNGEINLDFDSEGKLVGIEVLDADKKLPVEILNIAEKTSCVP